VNKTNQFNLNGRRFTEADWRAVLERPDAFLVRVSYQDKFGPLGKIATLFGTTNGETVHVEGWVMSCRAFSRRIEHHTLDRLFAHFGASTVRLNYKPTDRNMPLQEFLGAITREPVPAEPLIAAAQFREACRSLPHKVIEIHG
jgi:FkbH-like protein